MGNVSYANPELLVQQLQRSGPEGASRNPFLSNLLFSHYRLAVQSPLHCRPRLSDLQTTNYWFTPLLLHPCLHPEASTAPLCENEFCSSSQSVGDWSTALTCSGNPPRAERAG